MYKFIYSSWWKLFSVLLLLYVFIAGFKVPLKPGVISVYPEELKSGDTAILRITCYNTFLGEDDDISSIYLKIDSSQYLKAIDHHIIDRRRIDGIFYIPAVELNNSSATLICQLKNSEIMILPSAVRFSDIELADTSGIVLNWETPRFSVTPWSFKFPFRSILYETIRNTFFHVAIWFAMFILMIISLIYSVKYLRKQNITDDLVASSFASVAVLYGSFGMITGSIWAKNTWGAFWTNDPKLNMAAIAMMIYVSYLILRSSIENDEKRARISAAYNIFSFITIIPLVFIIPRLTSSLHPGNGGNPALGAEDMDNTLRMVFYPAVIGLALIGVWITSIIFRMKRIDLHILTKSLEHE